MALWDEEIESLRPAIRAEAAQFLAAASYVTEGNEGEPSERDMAAARALLIAREVHSHMAVDRTISGPGGDIRLRTFTPSDPARAVLLHFHGGGWARGRPEMVDLANEALAKERGIATVSVDYRLAPEHRFPHGPDDCEAAALWLIDHAQEEFGTDQLLIGGESAGAHLAALTLLRLRDRHGIVGRFAGANIVFGSFDFGFLPSHRGLNAGPDIIDWEALQKMADMVLPGCTAQERRRPEYSPLWADLRDMPPALFTVGLDDHLSDDSILMASRWERAGNHAELLAYPDAPHGCTVTMPTVKAHYLGRMYAFLDRCLADASINRDGAA